MSTEFKIGDKVLVEAQVMNIDSVGCPHYLRIGGQTVGCYPNEIYSHVPEIKPGTRVDVRNKKEQLWITEGEQRNNDTDWYIGTTKDGRHVIENKKGYVSVWNFARPHIEEETKPAKTVTVEVPEGYKVLVVQEE